jgi:hypothetical protein
LHLPASSSETVRVTPNAQPGTLVVLPVSASLHDHVFVAVSAMVERQDRPTTLANAHWSKDIAGENSIIVFASEYRDEVHNKNRLVMDFGATQ